MFCIGDVMGELRIAQENLSETAVTALNVEEGKYTRTSWRVSNHLAGRLGVQFCALGDKKLHVRRFEKSLPPQV